MASLGACALGLALLILTASSPAHARKASAHHHGARHHQAQGHHGHRAHHAKTKSHKSAGHLSPPLQIINSQYEPVPFGDIAGWSDDDALTAFRAFATSCVAVNGASNHGKAAPIGKALGQSLQLPCKAALGAKISDVVSARQFFENHFKALKIAKLGDAAGFVTGYYEPIIEGAREKSDEFPVPVYSRPHNLIVRGARKSSVSMPNRGQVVRKVGRRKYVPYYDRAQIEDGALEGRGLEICYVKSHTDLMFMQIQGSARIRLREGGMLRINYDSHNGYTYFPVGRALIDRGIYTKDEMSMQKIREWMEANPDGAKELRRMNRSYVFFREVKLGEKDEPKGAQGVALTPGRSIAVDKTLHVYGTPFFIGGKLPISGETSSDSFARLMIAQDTGSAILGPARADIYFGAGDEAGRVSGRLKHNAQFVMLIPNALDPVASGAHMPLPRARPSNDIAKSIAKESAKKETIKPSAGKAASDSATSNRKK